MDFTYQPVERYRAIMALLLSLSVIETQILVLFLSKMSASHNSFNSLQNDKKHSEPYLTPYHTIPTLNDHKEEGLMPLENTVGKGENAHKEEGLMPLENTVGKGENADNQYSIEERNFYLYSYEMTLKRKALENTLGKGENADNQYSNEEEIFILAPLICI